MTVPTVLPRLSVVLTPEQHHLLTRLAELQGRSAASYVRRLLDVATPSLRSLAARLEGVEADTAAIDENAQAAIAQMLDEAEDELAAQLDLLDLCEDEDEPSQEGREGAARADRPGPPDESRPPYSNTGVRVPQRDGKPSLLHIVTGGRDA